MSHGGSHGGSHGFRTVRLKCTRAMDGTVVATVYLGTVKFLEADFHLKEAALRDLWDDVLPRVFSAMALSQLGISIKSAEVVTRNLGVCELRWET